MSSDLGRVWMMGGVYSLYIICFFLAGIERATTLELSLVAPYYAVVPT
jgi:hypothetical protein